MRTNFICKDCHMVSCLEGHDIVHYPTGWFTVCPHCGLLTRFDIFGPIYRTGSHVNYNGQTGTVCACNRNEIHDLSQLEYTVHMDPLSETETSVELIIKHDDLKLLPSQNALTLDHHVIERVCHYYSDEEKSCYGCTKRTMCNAEIFDRLYQYEQSGLTPVDAIMLRDTLADANMSLSQLLKSIKTGDILHESHT